jgi:FdrA protein
VTAEAVEVHRGLYADSVTLMLVSREVSASAGVSAALVAMATDLNLQLLGDMGFTPPEIGSANELFIAIRADDDEAVALAALAALRLLEAPRRDGGNARAERTPPRTIGAAALRGGPGIALISVPGEHAFTEAMDALESGCDVMIFSDNVSVAQEIVLKDRARDGGLLVMGPDCGTALVGGVGLGFSHTVDRGPVGIVAASGTGAQQVLCLLDAAGVGVTAALGVGGRDLSDAVGGRSTFTALARLDADPDTEVIVVISKPASAASLERLRTFAGTLRTPVQLALLGPGQPDLTAATEEILRRLGRPVPAWPAWLGAERRTPGALRGLFCGGTLCDEAMLIASEALGTIRSNIPLRPEWALPASLRSDGHYMIDLGDDALTQGRAHPMIDPTLRQQHLRSALADPATGVVLLDVVLGHASHRDPAAEVARAITGARAPVVVSLVGARRDPQGLDASAGILREAGASVFFSNAAAARHAVSLVAEPVAR